MGDLIYPVVDLLHLAAARGVVCYGPSQGNEPTFVRADAWLPNWRDVSQEEAEGLLLCRYLHTFGPATAADFALWTGITLTDARRIWAREENDFVSVNVEGWTGALLRKDVDQLLQAEFNGESVRLLPYFDTFLIGHRDREHLIAIEHHGRIYRPQGWIAPVILVNGRIVAVWKYALERDYLGVTVEKLGTISRRVLDDIEKETQDLARFLEVSKVDIQIR